MRGYQLPIIYLHYNKRVVAGLTQESFDIIDGQQRIIALHLFVEGAFSLYKADDERAGFPKFLRNEPCPWGGKDFHGLSDDLKSRLLETNLPVAYITTDNTNEVRDLFVRLQSGFPLNAQEKRDSYPGQFTDFILSLGGKPAIPQLRAHDAIHLVLLLDSIWEDYTRSWESTLQEAQGRFSAALAKSVESNKKSQPDETWLRYGIWTRSNSDRSDNIRRRHQYYSRCMIDFLGYLIPKDPKRVYGHLEREIIYWRDEKKCRVCGAEVLWSEAEIHHIAPHTGGGRTEYENGVLVHQHCHPKSASATKELAKSFGLAGPAGSSN